MPKGKLLSKIYLIEAIPISRSTRGGPLSYFSSEKVGVGQMILAPLRRKEVLSVVVAVRSARDAKSLIRKADFSLKKIPKKSILKARLSKDILSLVKLLEEYYATGAGVILASILPKVTVENPDLLTSPKRKRSKEKNENVSREPLVLQMEKEERFGQYRSLIRQSFARGKSVLFITPSAEEADEAYEKLSRGIPEYAFLITSQKKKEEQKTSWLQANTMSHPVLVVSTPMALVFDRKDLETYVLERENSRSYRAFSRPYLNYKTLVLLLARLTKRDVVLGDSVLSIESLMREKEGRYGELSPIKWRVEGAETSLVDMKKPAHPSMKTDKVDFQIFSPALLSLMKKSLEEKKGIFLFGARKGLAPTTICGDCGVSLPCKICGAPVVLHSKNQRLYLCHRCGEKREPETVCDNCGSWKLTPIGIGTELIAREAKKEFPHAKVLILDKEHARSKSRVSKIKKEFQESGGILVGTEMAVLHLDQSVYSAVVSLDALFSLPDFGAEERIFYLISRLREITENKLIIQTRNMSKEVLSWSAQGNTLDFYKRELQDRQNFSYPPITLFIKVESPEIDSLKHDFEKWQPEFMRKAMIIRMPRAKWPDKELSDKLALLPPNFLVKVDPESLI